MRSYVIVVILMSMVMPRASAVLPVWYEQVHTGTVSEETGPVEYDYMVHPWSDNVLEFNVSDNDTIFVRIWDTTGKIVYWDTYDNEEYLIIDNKTRDWGLSSSDWVYWRSHPGLPYTWFSDEPGYLRVEISGHGNYTYMAHWKELSVDERGYSSTTTGYSYQAGPILLFLGVGTVILLILAGIAFVIWIWWKDEK